MFVRDPCGIVCIIFTYVAVFYADYVVVRWIVMQTMYNRYEIFNSNNRTWDNMKLFSLWGALNVVCFNTVILLLSMAHMRAVLSDPGTVPLPQSRVDFSDIHCAESGVCVSVRLLAKARNNHF